ncbi:DNA-directed DNA polymerase II small subunit [Candidatus Bathyarchaeota archaeon]|nr:DNA-directed DNA polymerase II small subunit [Candidatus Bathyarchaeota archaeon]
MKFEEQIMSEGERIQKAVSFTISSGYQLDKEAFDFLNSSSKTEDPLYLMKEAIKKIRDMPQKPLFIDRVFLETMKKEECCKEEKVSNTNSFFTTSELRKTFRPYAKDVEEEVKILNDPTKKVCTTGTLIEFLEYFQDRFERLKKILRKRMDVKNAIPISIALKSRKKSKINVIGMVREKIEVKGRLFVRIEDLEACITVLVSPNVSKEIIEKAHSLLLDQVICVNGIKANNDLIIAKDFIFPEIPQKTPHRASIPIYAALMSDLHVGSKKFMAQEFNRFLSWLKGKKGNDKIREIAGRIKYLVIAGDIVDGIGIYPGQHDGLAITDIYEQYKEAAKLIEQIPEYIEVIIIPGNHDASRKALPQPALPKDYVEPLNEARKIFSIGNPSTISLHGVELLLFHGRSLDDIAAVAPNVSFDSPDKSMKLMLQGRHLAPIYGERTPIAPEKQDFMVIERVPDIFHAGHVHVIKCNNYKGTLIVNSGAWQEQTDFQQKMGLKPDPGILPIVNLQTSRISTLNFTKEW